MNSLNNTLAGLASSLFLNVGLTSVAEKFDPMHSPTTKSSIEMVSAESCENCTWICNFTPEAGQ